MRRNGKKWEKFAWTGSKTSGNRRTNRNQLLYNLPYGAETIGTTGKTSSVFYEKTCPAAEALFLQSGFCCCCAVQNRFKEKTVPNGIPAAHQSRGRPICGAGLSTVLFLAVRDGWACLLDFSTPERYTYFAILPPRSGSRQTKGVFSYNV